MLTFRSLTVVSVAPICMFSDLAGAKPPTVSPPFPSYLVKSPDLLTDCFSLKHAASVMRSWARLSASAAK